MVVRRDRLRNSSSRDINVAGEYVAGKAVAERGTSERPRLPPKSPTQILISLAATRQKEVRLQRL